MPSYLGIGQADTPQTTHGRMAGLTFARIRSRVSGAGGTQNNLKRSTSMPPTFAGTLGTKATNVGASSPEAIAKIVLSELMRARASTDSGPTTTDVKGDWEWLGESRSYV